MVIYEFSFHFLYIVANLSFVYFYGCLFFTLVTLCCTSGNFCCKVILVTLFL